MDAQGHNTKREKKIQIAQIRILLKFVFIIKIQLQQC